MKRRKLSIGQDVIIIYEVDVGFVQKNATFVEYRSIPIGKNLHQIPIFKCNEKEVSGLDCFWLLPSDVRSADDIHKFQYELISTQVAVSYIAKCRGYNITPKVKSRKLNKMADEKTEQKLALIQKFGFDPTDDSWIETDLAHSVRERKWFRFERDNHLIFNDNWDEVVNVFNQSNQDTLTIEEAKSLSKKRMRYILGAYNLRYSGEKNKRRWIEEARQFERTHREREDRMLLWSYNHKNKFPLVRVKKPIRFFAGPYFNQCIEKAPHVFKDTSCQYIREDVVLRVVSYDSKDKYIRLDFTDDVRQLIKSNDSKEPWIRDSLDYDFWVKPSELDSHLEFIEDIE